MKKTTLCAAAMATAIAAPAMAQEATDHASQAMGPQTEAAPAAPTPAPTATAVTDAEVDSFAAAVVDIQKIDADATIAAEDQQAHLVATVGEHGLPPQRFNEISTQTQSDPALQQRVQVAMSALATPAG